MADTREIPLPGGQHTNFSDECWFLLISDATSPVVLECRFQSDAVPRTGYPDSARTEFCTMKSEEEALCKIPFDQASDVIESTRLSFIPERVWEMAVNECRQLLRG